MSVLKQQYEEKMEILQQQIKSVESERDKVLKDMSEEGREGGKVVGVGGSEVLLIKNPVFNLSKRTCAIL